MLATWGCTTFPKPTLSLDFLGATSLDSGITFSRGSQATLFDSTGTLVYAKHNLLTYSEDFANAAWTKTRSSITSNTIVAPDGTLTGDKLVEDTTASNTHEIQQAGITVVSGTTYACSIYLKAAERTKARVIYLAGGVGVYADADLSAGTIGAATGFSGGTAVSSSIQSVGNGWYRCAVVGSQSASTSGAVRVELLDASGNRTYTGNGTSGIYIWGAQLETGAFATSYIPTTTTALTRNADIASMTGTNFSSWYSASEGTLYGEVSSAAITVGGASRRIANINNGTESNRITVAWAGLTGVGAAFVSDGGVTQAGFNSPSGAYPFPTKVALAYKVNDFQAAVNGSAFAADTNGTVPTVDRMTIGDVVTGGTGPQNINGHIRRIAYYPLCNTNVQLQALTG